MGLITFDARDDDNLVSETYSQGRGSVLRSPSIEVTRIRFAQGEGAQLHRHPEEQFLYVLEGKFRVTLDGEDYEVGAGQGSYHPSDAEHGTVALEETVALSFKNLVAPIYEATGDLH